LFIWKGGGDVLIVIVAAGVFLAIVLIVVGVAAPRTADDVQARLMEYGAREATSLEELELSMPFSERVIKPIIGSVSQFMSRFTPEKTIEQTRHSLELAGRPNNWGPTEFLAVRGMAAVLLAVLAFLLFTVTKRPFIQIIGATAVGGVFGFLMPVIWLGSKIRSRQSDVVKSLPDALDLLTISVEAGLGFDAAMAKVAEKWDNEVSRGFARVIQEIRIGKLRREALRSMAENMDVPDVTSFVAAIIQADQLGVSIAKILRVQSDQMRIRRRQRAEEKAHQAPIKMLFPMVFLIFPAIWIVLLGPAVLIVKNSGVLGTI
jgi:tight adherence protein C